MYDYAAQKIAAEALLNDLRAKGATLATAESCTGGGVAHVLTAIAGSSDVVLGGVVSYANAVKSGLLGVSENSLREYGAVSETVAREMAAGAQSALHADFAISTTGIAGPGASDFKPEGLVCFGFALKDRVITESVKFGALGRENVRDAAIFHALTRLRAIICDNS